MTRILLTGMGAGAAATLLFVLALSGAALSLFLFCLAPLPIMIVALGWSPWAGLLAALAAATMLSGPFGPSFFASFLTSIGMPACWLGYLALLGRPAATGEVRQTDWYPPGRLVLWAAVLGAAAIAVSLATLGSDEATIRRSLRDAIEAVQSSALDTPDPSPQFTPRGFGAEDPDAIIDALLRMLPLAAVTATLTQTGNLWLAGLVVRLSGRLRRPWPDLTLLSLPPLAVALYAACLAVALLPGLPGLFARLFAATLTLAFTMVGLAVMHAATRGVKGRAPLLWGAYGAIFFLLWPVVAIVGVAETLFGLRQRFSGPGPPAARPPEDNKTAISPTDYPDTDN